MLVENTVFTSLFTTALQQMLLKRKAHPPSSDFNICKRNKIIIDLGLTKIFEEFFTQLGFQPNLPYL